MEAVEIHEEPAEGEGSDEGTFWIIEDSGRFDFGAGVLEEFRVIDAGGASGHAGQTAEAEIHFVSERLGRFQAFVGDCAHEGDATSRAVSFQLGAVVSGARGQAQSAMHALLHHGVVQVAEMGMGAIHRGRGHHKG